MLAQASLRAEETSLPLQVETTQAALSKNVSSERRSRLLWTGFGFAVLVVIGVSACAPNPVAAHASVQSSRPVQELAFRPMPMLSSRGIRQAVLPGAHFPGAVALPRRGAVAPRWPTQHRDISTNAMLSDAEQALENKMRVERMIKDSEAKKMIKDAEMQKPATVNDAITGSSSVGVGAAVGVETTATWNPQHWKQWQASDLHSSTSRIELNDGNEMPVMGLGAAMAPESTRSAVLSALELGYRFVDTAQNYGNEAEVGAGVRDFLTASGLSRQDVFVSSKLDPDARTFKDAVEAGKQSAATLGLGYVDRMLIHSPHGGKLVEIYDALLELQSMGIVKSIGVANFDQSHLDMLEYYERPAPAVNQIEMHPLVYPQRVKLVEYCRSAGIQVEAFCPVLCGSDIFLKHGTLPDIAQRIGHTPAQILLRWGLQHGFTVIPKSIQPERQAENRDIFDFELQTEDLEELKQMEGLLNSRKLVLYPTALDVVADSGSTSSRLKLKPSPRRPPRPVDPPKVETARGPTRRELLLGSRWDPWRADNPARTDQ